MGKQHALSGMPVGLGLSYALGITEYGLVAAAAVITVGYALFPDYDHPSSSVTRLLGWFGTRVSEGLRWLSAAVYARTKGPRDEPGEAKHRHLTHTVVFAVTLGGVCAGLAAITPWAMLPIALFGVLAAADRLGDWMLLAGSVGIGAAVLEISDGNGDHLSWQIGVFVAAGCITHCLGDALTVSGCPFLWIPGPLGRLTTWAGETWYEIRLLGRFSFRTNTFAELWVVRPLLIAATCAALLLHVDYLAPVLEFVGAVAQAG